MAGDPDCRVMAPMLHPTAQSSALLKVRCPVTSPLRKALPSETPRTPQFPQAGLSVLFLRFDAGPRAWCTRVKDCGPTLWHLPGPSSNNTYGLRSHSYPWGALLRLAGPLGWPQDYAPLPFPCARPLCASGPMPPRCNYLCFVSALDALMFPQWWTGADTPQPAWVTLGWSWRAVEG